MNHSYPSGDHYVEPTAVGSWFRSPGTRETIESVLIAILLALLFRFFEAEAYVIPTGSMAPDLQGRHIDVACPECDYEYRTGASEDQLQPTRVACPICQNPLALLRQRDHRPFSGDRILVNKYAYDFAEPERWDVIVFKYPNNGKQNFIKRLIGKPNEGVLIEHGDIYAYDRPTETFQDRRICRKPPRKLKAMLQMVDDTDHIAETLRQAGWPSRWQQWDRGSAKADWTIGENLNQFSLSESSGETKWLRYRHLIPYKSEWDSGLGLRNPELPKRIQDSIPAGELITDHYAYNEPHPQIAGEFSPYNGLHWVGDLAMQADLSIQSSTGELVLETVEGGIAFQCVIDIATGQATFGWSNPFNQETVSFQGETEIETPVKGAGDYELLFANCDDMLYLWVDGKFVGGCEYSRTGNVVPQWQEDRPGDAEPAGIGGANIDLQISRLQIMRDIYYTSKNGTRQLDVDTNPSVEYLGFNSRDPMVLASIRSLMRKPADWDGEFSNRLFSSRQRDESFVFPLDEDQFLPMGDNSPHSSDARIWDGPRMVDRSFLLGEALFIYWPHAKTRPIPFWPNFGRMNFIH